MAIGKVKWTANVAVSLGNGSWTFKSNGLPASNFEAADYAVPSNPFAVTAAGASVVMSSSVLRDQSYDYTLPLRPEYSKKVTTTNQGPIGFLLDGAALFNPYEANHSTVATSDNFDATANGITASFLDSCDGHPGPGGQYTTTASQPAWSRTRRISRSRSPLSRRSRPRRRLQWPRSPRRRGGRSSWVSRSMAMAFTTTLL